MTHIHKFRLPIRHRHPNALRHIAWTAVILLAVYGLWWSMTSARAHYLLVSGAEARIARSDADKQELLDVLAGRLQMVEPVGDTMAKVATIKWELVEVVK